MRIKNRIMAGALAVAIMASMVPSAFTASAAQSDVTSGLIAQYKFDEKTGTTFKNSVTGVSDATYALKDTTGLWGGAGLVASPNGKALAVNNHKYTRIPASALAGVTDVTIQMYAKVNDSNNWSRLWSLAPYNAENTDFAKERMLGMSARDNGGRKLGIGYKVAGKGDEVNFASATNFDTQVKGAYHLITFVQSGTTAAIYVDGTEVASKDVGERTVGGIVAACDEARPAIFALGYAAEWPDMGMNTEIDDFRVYGKALDAAAITAQVDKFAAGKAEEISNQDLIYNFDFNEAADDNTIANKVSENPNCSVFREEIGKVNGTIGDGAIAFNNRDSQSHAHVYAKANQLKSVNSQTFSMWVKPERTDRQFLFTSGPLDNVKYSGNNALNRDNYVLGTIVDDRIKFEAKVNGVGQSFDTARMIFEPNTYYLITFQKEGNTGRIFINNAEVAQKTDFTVDLSTLVYNKYGSDVDYKIDIGGSSVWGDGSFVEEGLQGELDEFRIYDRAISASEVNHIYSSFATKAGTTPYASLGDEGTEVVYALNTVANFSGFRDNVASSKGDNQWRGKALADGSVLATRYGGSDHFLWGPRIPEAKRTKIVTGSTYYIKTLVKVSNTDRIKDKTAGENVFDFNTVGGKVSATFDKATFDANPAFYGGKLLKEGEWIPLVWSFTATDATDRGIEWSMLSQMGVSNNNSMDYFLQISNKIVISENSIALAPPSGPTVSPYFGADNGDISKTSQWDQGKDVYYAWDLNFVGGQDRRIRVPDGSTVALESNHIYYSMSLPTEKRTIAAGTDYYFKLLLKLDNFKDVDMSKYVLEWDWNDKPIEGQIMPEVLKAKEGEWVSLVYKLNDATKLNTGGEGRFRLQGSRAYKLYGSRYLVLSTDSTPLALPSDVDAAVPVKNSIDNLVKPREIKVEFENLTSIVNDTKATESNADGWVLGNTDVNGTICKYPAIDFDTKVNDTISVRYSAKAMAGSAASYIEFRADDPVTGPVIGTVATPDTGAWTTFKTATGAVTNNVTGVHDVYAIIYKPGVGTDVPQYVGNLNWFSFSSSTEPVLSNEKIPAAKAIRTAYNALTATQKALVSNYETFVSSEVTLGLIQQAADQTAADAVITKIVDLPSANAIKVTDKDAIVAARTAYTALTAAQKALVLNLDALTTAETALAAAENKAAADVVVENIADLPSTSAIKATDEEAIVAARAAYTALTAAQKALVTNLDTLVNAEYVLNLLTSSSSEVGVTGVTLNKTNESLKVGATLALVATIAPDNATNKNVNWFTSNEKVATVDANGNVKAIGNGTATITAITASGTKIAKCTVAVTTPVTSVKLNATTATINKGSSQNLTATINPSTASNKEVQWTSGNKNVATVDSNGKVTAKAFGVTTIYATTSNGLKASCTVYVKGWYQSAGKWYFNDGKGKVTNKWFQDGSKWYYVDTKGVMQTSKWIKSSGKYYYVDSKGVMLTNKWIKSGGKWYYVDKNGIMFVNTSKKIGSKTYKFNKSGACINP